MSSTRWAYASVLATGLALVLDSCKTSTPEPPPQVRKLKVTFASHLNFGPVFLAQEKGFFAAEGLEVEMVHISRPEESLVALLSGEVDALLGPLGPGLFAAIAKGAPVRIVAGMNHLAREGCTYYGLVLRPGLTPAQALRRLRRIDAGRDGTARYLASRMLAAQGINIDTIETVKLPTAVIDHSLETGAVDAAALSEPVLTRNLSHGTLWLRGQDANPDFLWTAISFGERLLRKDREAGIRFLAAFRRGVAAFNAGKTPSNLEVLQRATEEDREILEKSCWPTFLPNARVNVGNLVAYQEWAHGHGYLDQVVPAATFWDSSFVAASDAAVTARR